ncbi:17571_t:CDS:2 [Acaulospora colombiana]|uniref:17571_t:CDS:1 n=1 Tax=Acaulospora colombiana TaxID=27376 RepID=A0ACA9PFG6_9GLOM|nr:17571_t:CDS:2 [Acaulospora colombiana]
MSADSKIQRMNTCIHQTVEADTNKRVLFAQILAKLDHYSDRLLAQVSLMKRTRP